MNKIPYVVLVIAVAVWFGKFSFADCNPYHEGPVYTLGVLYAAEHGGAEHGGAENVEKEHGGEGAEHGGEKAVKKEHGGTAEPKGSFGAKQGGAEHGGEKAVKKEHGGANQEDKGSKGHTKPAADDIRGTMKNHVLDESKETGVFTILDEETGQKRRLALVRVHERVGKTGDYYYSCADFKDVDSGELLDLDLDVEQKDRNLSVVDVRIHKVEGKKRYTYDENDNRIPIIE